MVKKLSSSMSIAKMIASLALEPLMLLVEVLFATITGVISSGINFESATGESLLIFITF
jgi:hypothetical protein